MKAGDEGPSVEVTEEESKDGADVKPSKEKLNSMEIVGAQKPPGEKYSPKVHPCFCFFFISCFTVLLILSPY